MDAFSFIGGGKFRGRLEGHSQFEPTGKIGGLKFSLRCNYHKTFFNCKDPFTPGLVYKEILRHFPELKASYTGFLHRKLFCSITKAYCSDRCPKFTRHGLENELVISSEIF